MIALRHITIVLSTILENINSISVIVWEKFNRSVDHLTIAKTSIFKRLE